MMLVFETVGNVVLSECHELMANLPLAQYDTSRAREFAIITYK